jgi:hypothetical protein
VPAYTFAAQCRPAHHSFALPIIMFCSTVASGHTILRADKVQSDAGISTMPRDMTCTGRYPPQPRYPPFAFYSAIR